MPHPRGLAGRELEGLHARGRVEVELPSAASCKRQPLLLLLLLPAAAPSLAATALRGGGVRSTTLAGSAGADAAKEAALWVVERARWG